MQQRCVIRGIMSRTCLAAGPPPARPKMYFHQVHPFSPALSSNPMAYRKQVLLYLDEVGESTVKGIVEHLNRESKFEMTGGKIGQLMRVMMLEGTVARKHVCIDGHGVSVYALNRVLGSEGSEEE